MIVYKITNLINNKIYIGRDKHERSTYYGSGKLIIAAIKKYGKENFKKEIIDKASTIEELNEKEIFWIEKLEARNLSIGYNLQKGGQGGDWNSLTEDQKNHIRKRAGETSKNRKHSAEQIAKMRIAMKGKNTGKRSLETREKMSLKRRGIKAKRTRKTKFSDNTRQKMSTRVSGENNPMYGRKHNPVSIEKMKIKAKNRKIIYKTFKTYIFLKNDIVFHEVEGQKSAIKFCKENNLPYSIIIKKFLKWKEWECKTTVTTRGTI